MILNFILLNSAYISNILGTIAGPLDMNMVYLSPAGGTAIAPRRSGASVCVKCPAGQYCILRLLLVNRSCKTLFQGPGRSSAQRILSAHHANQVYIQSLPIYMKYASLTLLFLIIFYPLSRKIVFRRRSPK